MSTTYDGQATDINQTGDTKIHGGTRGDYGQEVFLWSGPESGVDAAIRRHRLPNGWWFRSYKHPEILGNVQLYKVAPTKRTPRQQAITRAMRSFADPL